MNKIKLFGELCMKLIKPVKPCIVEESHVTALNNITSDNNHEDDSDT